MAHSILNAKRLSTWAAMATIPLTLGLTNVNAEILEEVIVTAQKREQSIQDVGIAVTALTGDQMNALGMTNAQHVTDMAPGVSIVQPNGVSSFSLAIRGVVQSDFADHQEAPVSIYVDEAYVSQTSAAGFMLFDLERVEILRGPQGTLFGRNATGGLANFITRKPTQEVNGYAEARFGSYDQKGFEGAIGGGLTDNIAVRLSAALNTHDPYVRNRVGQDLNDGNEYAIRGQFSIDVSENLNVLLNGRASAMEIVTGGADYTSATWDTRTGFGTELPFGALQPAPGPGSPTPADAIICPGCDYFGFAEPDENIYTGSFDVIGHNDLHVTGGGARVTWDFPKFTMTSISDYYAIDKDYGPEDSDGGPLSGVQFYLANEADQFSQEIRFNGELEKFRWVAGFYYLHIDGQYGTGFEAPATLSTVGAGRVAANDLVDAFGPGLPSSHPAGDIGIQSAWETKTNSWSLFSQVEYDVMPDLTAIVGFRWIDEEKKHDYEANFNIFSAAIPGGKNYLFNPNILFTQFTFDSDSVGDLATQSKGLWSAKAALEWQATDATLAYFTWNRGIKGGGFNAPLDPGTLALPDGSQNNEAVPFKEEVVYAYEVGLKQDLWDGRARLNVNAFYYDYQDFQAFIFENLSQIVLNADSETYGAEIEFQASPVRGLDFSAGAAYLNARVKDVDFGFGPVDRTPPRSSKWNINSLLRYQFVPVFTSSPWAGHFALQADFNYRSDFSFILTNSPAGKQPGYVIGNVRGSYTTEDGRWEAAVGVKNVADQFYFSQIFDLGSAFGNIQRFIDRPRWITASIRFNWD